MELKTIQQELIEQINKGKTQYITDGYYMSIGELLSMYKEGDLIINPDFQRTFRWTLRQQTKLVESILIGVPLPSIFVYQDENGRWEIVDGVQRVSTIFAFMGELLDESQQKQKATVLESTKLISSLQDITWAKLPREPVQLDFRRSKLEIKIIKYLSDKNAKYEVFQRLNSGGTPLSEQEFRNCVMIAFYKNLYTWMETLSQNAYFMKCIDLTDRWKEQKYDRELILRLFAFPLYSDFKRENINDYLNDAYFDAKDSIVNKVNNNSFNLEVEKEKFIKTFRLLDKAKGQNVFKKQGRGMQFLESYFEIIAVGLYFNIDDYEDTDTDIKLIKHKIDAFAEHTEYKNIKTSIYNSVQRAKRTVSFGKSYFQK